MKDGVKAKDQLEIPGSNSQAFDEIKLSKAKRKIENLITSKENVIDEMEENIEDNNRLIDKLTK